MPGSLRKGRPRTRPDRRLVEKPFLEVGRPAPAQASNLPLDAHLHTELSPDSMVPLELYAAQAAERGIPEIAITDHLDFTPGAPAYGRFSPAASTASPASAPRCFWN